MVWWQETSANFSLKFSLFHIFPSPFPRLGRSAEPFASSFCLSSALLAEKSSSSNPPSLFLAMFRNHSRGQKDSLYWGLWALSVVWVISETNYLISSSWQDLLSACLKKTNSKSFEPLERCQIGVQAPLTSLLQFRKTSLHIGSSSSTHPPHLKLLHKMCKCYFPFCCQLFSPHHLLLQIMLWKRNSDVCFQMKNDNPWVTCSSTLTGKL